MPVYKAELSAESLSSLIENVRVYQRKAEAAPQKLLDMLVTSGAAALENNIHGIQDKDGNDLAAVGTASFGNHAILYMHGEQAAYLEYGTGEIGAVSPHPQSAKAGWNYASGTKIQTTKDGRKMWRYRQKGTDKWKYTQGIPAGRVVLRTGGSLRNGVVDAAKEVLK